MSLESGRAVEESEDIGEKRLSSGWIGVAGGGSVDKAGIDSIGIGFGSRCRTEGCASLDNAKFSRTRSRSLSRDFLGRVSFLMSLNLSVEAVLLLL